MIKCYFKNTDDENKVYSGKILTSFENFQRQPYIDLTEYVGLNGEIDWINSHIKSVSKENILGFYEDIEGFKEDFPQYFI